MPLFCDKYKVMIHPMTAATAKGKSTIHDNFIGGEKSSKY